MAARCGNYYETVIWDEFECWFSDHDLLSVAIPCSHWYRLHTSETQWWTVFCNVLCDSYDMFIVVAATIAIMTSSVSKEFRCILLRLSHVWCFVSWFCCTLVHEHLTEHTPGLDIRTTMIIVPSFLIWWLQTYQSTLCVCYAALLFWFVFCQFAHASK